VRLTVGAVTNDNGTIGGENTACGSARRAEAVSPGDPYDLADIRGIVPDIFR